MNKIVLSIVFLLSASAFSESSATYDMLLFNQTTLPTAGKSKNGQLRLDVSSNVLKKFNSSTGLWESIGTGGGSGDFGSLTSGTNTSATMTVGTGATLSPTGSGSITANAFSGIIPVANGGTGLSSGTSGGILGFTASGVITSSSALTANAIVLGGGAGATPSSLGSTGTSTTMLHGNASGAPTFGAASLTADVSGVLPFANGGTNNSSSYTSGSVPFSDGISLTQNNTNFTFDTSAGLAIGLAGGSNNAGAIFARSFNNGNATIVARSRSAQTANLLELQSSAGSNVLQVDKNGNETANNVVANGFFRTPGNLFLYEPGNNFRNTINSSPSLAANLTITLPNTAGSSGYVLTTDGAGNTSWAAAPAASDCDVAAITVTDSPYTITGTSCFISCDASGGDVTIILTGSVKKIVSVLKIDSSANNCILDPLGSDTINSAANLNISTQWFGHEVIKAGGSTWYTKP